MASQRESQLSSRAIFLERENLNEINARLKLRGRNRVHAHQIAPWYDAYMCKYELDYEYIENVMTWVRFMSENYIREYRGHHCITSEEIPYLPYQDQAISNYELNANIKQTRPDGKYPKFCIESAVEDKRDADGNIIIRTVTEPTRVYIPPKSYRYGKTAVKTSVKTWGGNGSRLIDKDYRGSLYDWELIHRPHTKRDMSIFYTNS